MRITLFSSQSYDQEFFNSANADYGHQLTFVPAHLRPETLPAAQGADAICAFVNDKLDAEILGGLKSAGVKLILLRCAGFNHVDLEVASELGLRVARVPAYSPHAVAEHTVALLLSLNRKIHRAHARVREGNFSLAGLVGFDLNGRTVGVIGAGRIGSVFCRIMRGFGCRVLAYDEAPDQELERDGVELTDQQTLLGEADIVSLHCPLTPKTHHLIDRDALALMRPGAILLNTGRGGLVDSKALIDDLKRGHLGGVALDVYEEEEELFFEDLSSTVITDDVFARLLTFPHVLITAHQGFFTSEALTGIAHTTLSNATAFETGQGELHEVGS